MSSEKNMRMSFSKALEGNDEEPELQIAEDSDAESDEEYERYLHRQRMIKK